MGIHYTFMLRILLMLSLLFAVLHFHDSDYMGLKSMHEDVIVNHNVTTKTDGDRIRNNIIKSRENNDKVVDIVNHGRKFTAYKKLSEEEMYRKFGYRVIANDSIVPFLEEITPTTCEQVFSHSHNSRGVIPSSIPPKLFDAFLMYRHIRYSRSRVKRPARPSLSDITWSGIDQMVSVAPAIPGWHDNKPQAWTEVWNAFTAYPVRGMNGLVYNGHTETVPWVQVYALKHGAASVTTASERRIHTGHPTLHHVVAPDPSSQFDFIVSYYTIQSLGLSGALDPMADIREVQRMRCLLRPGGLLFLGLPFAKDKLVYPSYRNYNRLRLAMVFAGWSWEETFGHANFDARAHSLTQWDTTLNAGNDYFPILFVLRKKES